MLSAVEARNLIDRRLGGTRLVAHCLFVGDLMAALAERIGAPAELWRATGYCHDLDYFAIDGDWSRHGLITVRALAGRLPEEALEAIAAHDHRTGRTAATPLADALKLADALAVAEEALGRSILAARLLERGGEDVLVAGKPWLDATIGQAADRLGLDLLEITTMLPLLQRISR
jgi:predicted hydrolase (HD superfamily)